MSNVRNYEHTRLVGRAARWLSTYQRCGVVIREMVSGGCRSIPDAIGWRFCGNESILVECKASLSDFRRDAKKWHRKRDDYSVGKYRWFLAPPGVIPLDELPHGWGLIEDAKKFPVLRESILFERDERQEIAILFSAARRHWSFYKGIRLTSPALCGTENRP